MNRRSFIERLALGMAGFTILPGAGRVWKVTRAPVLPFWMHSPYYAGRLSDEYQMVLQFFGGRGHALVIKQPDDPNGLIMRPSFDELPPITTGYAEDCEP